MAKVYTDEVVEEMVADYKAAEDDEARSKVVAEWAKELEVSIPSVRTKLVSLGVYISKAKAKNAEVKVTKAKLVEDIAEAIGVSSETVESLEKATKPTLTKVRDALVELVGR